MRRSSLAALPTSRTPSTSGDDERTEEVSVSSEEWSTSDTQAERLARTWDGVEAASAPRSVASIYSGGIIGVLGQIHPGAAVG